MMSSTNKAAYQDEDWLQVSDTNMTSLELESSVNDDHDDDSYSTDEEEEEYELTSSLGGIQQPTPSRSTRFSSIRPCRFSSSSCILSSSALLLLLIAVTLRYYYNGDAISSHRPPGAVGVGHASYDTLTSVRIDEYQARATLYRHRATGAEFLAVVPDAARNGGGGGGGGGTTTAAGGGEQGEYYYDPKPDKVFGVAFRTKPESSTGVPHILERKWEACIYFVLLLLLFYYFVCVCWTLFCAVNTL